MERHLIDQGAEFKDATLPFSCETTQVHGHQIALRHQFCHRFLPRIVAAKEFVDAVAPIRIGPKAQSCKAPVEIGAVVDVGACQTPTEKIKELVGLETSAGHVSSAYKMNTASVPPARA